MTESQKKIIDKMNIEELKAHISIWLGNGHHTIAEYAKERLDKISLKHDAIILVEECSYD